MDDKLKLLCSNIRLLRTFHGMSQEEVAGAVNIARSTYSTYETGAKNIDLQTIDSLAGLYNISFDSLVNHDLSKGIFHKIYFDEDKSALISLLNNYQSLSVISRNLIEERMEVLLHQEEILYKEYFNEEEKKKPARKKAPQSKQTAGAEKP